MENIFTTGNLIALLTLTALEIVLGIDNIIFITILVGKLREEARARARRIGLFGAMLMRIGLLLGISWVMSLRNILFSIAGHGFSGKDLILLVGGLFLVGKSTHEIYHKLEPDESENKSGVLKSPRFWAIVSQIIIMDLIFSLDSVITAIGMAQKIAVMIAAVVVAVLVMMKFAGAIGAFVERHPSLKILALAFLILIGTMLVAEGLGQHVNKGYIYFAMAFSFGVELLNMRMRKKSRPVIGGISGDDSRNHAEEYRNINS